MSSNYSWLIAMCSLGLFGLALIDNGAAQFILMSALIAASLFLDFKGKQLLAWSLVLMICFFAQWGIGQFIGQQDLGLRLIGESVLGSSIDGVAKFGNGIVRGYGPFEHANIFGGICLLALILEEHLRIRGGNALIKNVIIFVLGIGIFVAFSRAAMFGWFILTVSVLVIRKGNRHARAAMGLFLLFIIVLWPLLSQRLNDSRDVAVYERMRGYLWSMQIMRMNNPWYGLGLSNYKVELKNYLDNESIIYQPWEADYVHSVPLMVTSQIGIISGSVLIIVTMIWLVKNVPGRSVVLLGSLLPVLLLDHFYVTQPVALMYLALSVILLRPEKLIN